MEEQQTLLLVLIIIVIIICAVFADLKGRMRQCGSLWHI